MVTSGIRCYPGINAAGGALLDYRVVTSAAIAADTMIALQPGDIWRLDDQDSDIAFSVSTSAMIEMNSVPTGRTDTPAAATATRVSLFQEDSSALKIVRRVSFAKRHASAVAAVTGIAYGGYPY
jgi:hypothetical protein